MRVVPTIGRSMATAFLVQRAGMATAAAAASAAPRTLNSVTASVRNVSAPGVIITVFAVKDTGDCERLVALGGQINEASAKYTGLRAAV